MKLLKILAVASMATLAAACGGKKGSDAAGNGADSSSSASSNVSGGPVGEQLKAVGDTVYFETDSYSVNSQGSATLQQQAQILNANPQVRVRIEGNADERGTREYNIALGDRRANAVKEALTSFGIDRSRVSTISYGKDQPICSDSTEACWQQNRRGTTVIVTGAGS